MLNIHLFRVLYFICNIFVFVIIPTICYASTKTEEEAFNCAISERVAHWSNRHPGKPGRRYSIETMGMRIKAEEEGEKKIVLYWDYDDDENDCANPISRFDKYGVMPIVSARCMDGNKPRIRKPMYQVIQGRAAPKLDCLEEESLQVRVVNPNDPDPEAFVFYAKVTTIDDDEEEPSSSSSSSQSMNSTTTTTTATPTTEMMGDMRFAAPPLPMPRQFMPLPTFGSSK